MENILYKKQLPGLDILKFFLAILIVAGHCNLFLEYPKVYEIQSRINSIAVPIFFSISSFLFSRKIYSLSEDEQKTSKDILKHTIYRLVILFLSWYLIMLPMTYVKWFSIATLKETIVAFVLSSTFSGYWFIKALLYNTVILYFCKGEKTLIICFLCSSILHFYCSFNYIYGYDEFMIKRSPYYSFYYHTAYFCIGALFAKYRNYINFDKWNTGLLFVFWLFFIIIYKNNFDPLFRFFSIFLIFPIFYQIKGVNVILCKNLRNMSIIFYMVQFALIWLYDEGCDKWLLHDSKIYEIMQFSITRFLIVLTLCFIISITILKGEKLSSFSFFKYLH